MGMKSTRAHTHSITQTDMHDLVQVIIFTPETHSSSGLPLSKHESSPQRIKRLQGGFIC